MPWQRQAGPILLYKGTNKSRTAAQGDGDVDSYTMPGGTMAADSVIRITAMWDVADPAGTAVIPGFSFGGTSLWTDAITTSSAHHDFVWIANQNSVSAQKVTNKFRIINDEQSSGLLPQTLAIDTSADVAIAATGGNLGGNNVIYLLFWTIELFK